MTTELQCSITQFAGQIRKEEAQEEIDRLNGQEKHTQWRMDTSDQAYIQDETEEGVSNPCVRSEGFVFLTKAPKSYVVEIP